MRGQSVALELTLTTPAPPVACRLTPKGVNPNTQPSPAWIMLNGVPAMVSIADRADPLALAATLKFTVPLPLPDDPLAMVTQDGWPVALHGQPLFAMTLTEPAPPAASNDAPGEESE